ncbi:MAG: 6-carboxytetrahydropterin synthase [Candidatus Latescibacteria bacterium]|jgi:6-pyruvoyltetrahydropterin/6-carboxytetrahydropterin synthase|nr:6-carboxytetrahydropterin synthase [Candidatus Latescibacterota bacterium]
METLRAQAYFHAAHRQIGYPGKCRHVHGHTWRGVIVVSAERLPRNDLDMAVDFGDLKDILRSLDHKMMVSQTDSVFLDESLFDQDGVVLIPGNGPSVENISNYVYDRVADVIRRQYPDLGISYHIFVEIQETDNNFMVVEGDAVI